MSLAQATAVYWLVKKWRLKTYSATYNPATSSYGPLTLKNDMVLKRSFEGLFGAFVELESEKQLVCGHAEFSASFYSENFEQSLRFFGDINPLALPSDPESTQLVIQKQNDKVFPVFFAQDNSVALGAVFSEEVFTYANDDTTGPTGTTTVDLKEFDVIEWGSYPFGGDMPTRVEIIAEEFWPYDPGDGGGPIYDSTTGAQLRAFP